MRTALRRCLSSASIFPSRSLAGRRYPIRTFSHTSLRRLSIIPPEEPPQQEDSKLEQPKVQHGDSVEEESAVTARETENTKSNSIAADDESAEQQDIEENTEISSDGGGVPDAAPETNGSASRKKGENGVAPVPDIPHWFMRHNVRTGRPKKASFYFPDVLGTSPADSPGNRLEIVKKNKTSEQQAPAQQDASQKGTETKSTTDPRGSKYRISEEVMSELLALSAMGLSPQSQKANHIFPGSKAHIVLHCAADNAHIFLDKVVMRVADTMEADLIMLGPQDIAQLAANYILDDPDVKRRGLWTLGYDTGPFIGQAEESGSRSEEAEEDEEDVDDDTPSMGGGRTRPHLALAFNLGDMTRFMGGGQPSSSGSSNGARASLSDMFNPFKSNSKILKHGNLTKLSSLLDKVITANQSKVEEQQPTTQESDAASTKQKQSRPTIIYVQNIKELKNTEHGHWIVAELEKKIKRKRDQGHRIMLMGSSTSAPPVSGRYREYMEGIMDENPQTNFRTISITPLPQPGSTEAQAVPNVEVKTWHKVGSENGHPDTLRRVMEINFRNVFNMIKRLQPGMKGVSAIEDCLLFFKELVDQAKKDNLGHGLLRGHGQVWSVDQVHRLVSIAIGQRVLRTPKHADSHGIQTQDVLSALKLLFESDRTKIHWSIMADANRKGLSAPPNMQALLEKDPSTVMAQDQMFQQDHEAKMKEITSTANRREKSLMRGVVNAQEIRVGFDDVHATDETKEALKTVTTLALTRPDAFKYGVLAKDKISGLLLYGPPGTGKTMLAKAVAKQSGATMLTVSGSDIYNMFVGEGEKNVRAVFSLAKKLAPTVVFLDEGDAILGSRGGSTERRSHRELINEFLKEWDGMNETTAFIMVATNRPFDLDDAVLRRLPRKILVDLPSEKDREAILHLHLKDEVLEDGVSIAKLAERTPLYSGSDLKNVAVAAALAAVREENEEAEKQGSAGDKKYPERRVLKQAHFEKALEEISASVNEDMGSLKAIKQFDERYGDGKGRKKKKGYGFVTNDATKFDTPKVRGP